VCSGYACKPADNLCGNISRRVAPYNSALPGIGECHRRIEVRAGYWTESQDKRGERP